MRISLKELTCNAVFVSFSWWFGSGYSSWPSYLPLFLWSLKQNSSGLLTISSKSSTYSVPSAVPPGSQVSALISFMSVLLCHLLRKFLPASPVFVLMLSCTLAPFLPYMQTYRLRPCGSIFPCPALIFFYMTLNGAWCYILDVCYLLSRFPTKQYMQQRQPSLFFVPCLLKRN